MRKNRLSEEAGQHYETAYDTHYTTKDIHKAFTLYEVRPPQDFRHERTDQNYCTSIS